MNQFIPSDDLEDGYVAPTNFNKSSSLPITIKLGGIIYLIAVVAILVINYVEFEESILTLFKSNEIQYTWPWMLAVLIGYGLCALTGVLILKGKSWPRIVILIFLSIFWLLFYFYMPLNYFSSTYRNITIIISGLNVITVILLYSGASTSWYKQERIAYIAAIQKKFSN